MSGGVNKRAVSCKKRCQKSKKRKDRLKATQTKTKTNRLVDATEALHDGLKSISTQISNLIRELKADFTSFKDNFKWDKREELAELKHEMNHQMAANAQAIQDQIKSRKKPPPK